jgi:hypothetical protein
MDLIDGVVIIGAVWSIIAGAGLYVYHTAITSRELEEFKQQNITLRAQNRPKEWWHEVAIEVAKHPEVLDKIIPLVGNVNLSTLLQNYLMKR